ncbi:phage integrase [Marinomonas pollencensis]|uniref:Site-specific recombinase XerD n=1 Tax=Marinomonas pollencensis TaxID=491954 RepID=A0A3E0DQ85_9GAMM|nr:tyrosine-type recombinase/integrase [Marinomonas pollencensis]REG85114.1 site-specific recombinase XerD [Marinomonas pollencensis]
MVIKKISSGYEVRFRVNGSGSREHRKVFPTKAECERFQRYTIAQFETQSDEKPWLEKTKDMRRLSELVELWDDTHGHFLRDGKRRKSKLLMIANELGDPAGSSLTRLEYTRWRTQRSKEGKSPKTLNNDLGYLSSMFNTLVKAEEIHYPNPLADIDNVRVPERELSYLTNDQITELLDEAKRGDNKHVYLITKISLSTGARWGEAEGLTTQRVRNNKVSFTDTKSGKNRSVPITPELYKEIHEHAKLTRGNKIFTPSISSFRRALKRTTIELPKGQAAHVLRHTFASHFIMNGGNILTLQKVLGHSDIKMTMRYAHLAPDFLEEATRLNPISKGI